MTKTANTTTDVIVAGNTLKKAEEIGLTESFFAISARGIGIEFDKIFYRERRFKRNQMSKNLFQKAKTEAAFLKMGLYGGNGSGKTFTASKIAIGLHQFIETKKPVFFLDSETGSDYVIPLFEAKKIKLHVAKTRAFSDLLAGTDEAEKNGSILIADSISHYWDELVETYKKSKNINRLFIQHWMEIKPIWREFSEKFVLSNLHIIICGRSGDIWEDVEDSEGVKELKKVGTKMRVEREMGYEPSLLVEMEKARLSSRPGSGWTHRAWVVKDRFDIIDGKSFDDPDFESFLPHIEKLNIGGKHRAFDSGRTSKDYVKSDNNNFAKIKQREKLLEKIKNEILLIYPSQTTEDKTEKIRLMKSIFGTSAWSEVQDLSLCMLESGLNQLEQLNEKEEK